MDENTQKLIHVVSKHVDQDKKEKAIELYEKIIFSKNKFYSILALNTVLEKNLIQDNNKILNYFKLVEKLNIPEEQSDLIIFKKALYLIKMANIKDGNQLLKDLINKNSKLTPLIEELVIE